MLSQQYHKEELKRVLIPRAEWHPFPRADDRGPWEALPASLMQAHIKRAEKLIEQPWPSLPAALYLDFARTGNRCRYEEPCFARRKALADLVIAECFDNRGRFADEILNGIWTICEESSWVIPAHCYLQKSGSGLPDISEHVVDLFAAETASLLAWTSYLLAARLDALSPLVNERIERELQARVLAPLLHRSDFWWMGFAGTQTNNWNPWIISNWIASALLIERDEERRLDHMLKAMRALDNFIDTYPSDGGCDEGPGYWGRAGGSLFDCLEWLYSTTGGSVNVYREPLIGEIGRFIYRTQIADGYFINFADAPSNLTPSPSVCFGYGRRIGDAALQALGSWAAARQELEVRGSSDCLSRTLQMFSALDEMTRGPAAPPLPRDVFLDRIELFAARDRNGSSSGFFVAAKGGHNAESHNHNDVGNIIVYLDGKPVLVDAGVEAYSSKTFSPQRYTIWTMQSAYHSAPMVNGIQQSNGREFTARGVSHMSDDRSATFDMDIARAYPAEAGIKSWRRTVTLVRGESLTLADSFELAGQPRETASHLLTACVPSITEHGIIQLQPKALGGKRISGSARLHFDPDLFEVLFEPVSLVNSSLKSAWGDGLTLIVFKSRRPAARGKWTLQVTR